MSKLGVVVLGVVVAIVLILIAGLRQTVNPGAGAHASTAPGGAVAAAALLRVPVSGVFPGGTPTGLNPDMPNPLANDPDAPQRGMRDFDAFNCSGCHAANAGGGMGPSLSNDRWIYRSSPANIYLTIAQGRSAGMPAFGAMLPDRTIWELVSYVKSISHPPGPTFGTTTSVDPQSPDIQQVPAGRIQTTTPWKYVEPMPPHGTRGGGH
jgi:cytochrome c oxidase cbb3-type subunit III